MSSCWTQFEICKHFERSLKMTDGSFTIRCFVRLLFSFHNRKEYRHFLFQETKTTIDIHNSQNYFWFYLNVAMRAICYFCSQRSTDWCRSFAEISSQEKKLRSLYWATEVTLSGKMVKTLMVITSNHSWIMLSWIYGHWISNIFDEFHSLFHYPNHLMFATFSYWKD